MELGTSDWIAIAGITIASILAIVGIFKSKSGKQNNINSSQSSGAFSKTKQKQSIKISDSDE